MTSLFRAEWQKITGYRIIAILLLWIYPVGAAMIMILALVAVLLSDLMRQNMQLYPPDWVQQSMMVWALVNSEIGRFLLVTFAAFVFAGEYQWGTWKNLVARRARTPLILTKFLAFTVLITVAILMAVVIVIAGVFFISGVAGVSPTPALNDGGAIGDAATDFLQRGVVTMTSAVIAAAYAALGGMLTRSIIGGVIVGFLLQFAESGAMLVPILLGSLLPAFTGLAQLYLFTPSYNLANLGSLAQVNIPYAIQIGPDALLGPMPGEVSLVLLVAWVTGLIALVTWLFRRQDIVG